MIEQERAQENNDKSNHKTHNQQQTQNNQQGNTHNDKMQTTNDMNTQKNKLSRKRVKCFAQFEECGLQPSGDFERLNYGSKKTCRAEIEY